MPQRPDYKNEFLPTNYPEGFFHRFTREESAAIQRSAVDAATPVNNLLARDLFLTLDKWRNLQGYAGSEDLLRIVIPTSLRTVAQRKMPVANLVNNLYLDRRSSELQDDRRLLASIDREMVLLKRNQLGVMFSRIFGLLERSPKLFRKTAGRDRCWGTMLLTNLGPVLASCFLPRRDGCLVLGDALLEEVQMLPGIPAYQCVNFSVSLYAGQLSLGMSFDSRVISRDDARGLLDCYLEQVCRSAKFEPQRLSTALRAA